MANDLDTLLGNVAEAPTPKKENPIPSKPARKKAKKIDGNETGHKLKTSLYLPPDKMVRLKVHVAAERTNISEFAEKAFDAQIKKDLQKRNGSIEPECLDVLEP